MRINTAIPRPSRIAAAFIFLSRVDFTTIYRPLFVLLSVQMKCPHCAQGIFESLQPGAPFQFPDGERWTATFQRCPECKRSIVYLEAVKVASGALSSQVASRFMVYPQGATPRPVPAEVPDPYAKDFNESVAVLPKSPKASAALSRRNLQAIIHDVAGIKARDLNSEIETLINSGKIPGHICEGLHAVRVIGNFAAHPLKSTSTGEIMEVEPGEAEWDLDVLEQLFDFYFVQPAILAKRKAEINKKLVEAGKPTI
jgi:hypothetical protein